MTYRLEIRPAILPNDRHKIEKFLEHLGFYVSGGGTDTDLSMCDISFDTKRKIPKDKQKSRMGRKRT
jgi:hypothetical protein